MKEIRTERLYMRPITAADAGVVGHIMNTYPEMSEFMTWSPPVDTDLLAKRFKAFSWDEMNAFGVFDREDHSKFIGRVTLRNFVWSVRDASKSSAFLSIWVSPECGRKGYGTEMMQGICDYAFKTLKLRKLFAGVFIENIPSQRLMEKMKFRKIGVSRKHYLKDGKEIDSTRYELLYEDWVGEKLEEYASCRSTEFSYISEDVWNRQSKYLEFRALKEDDATMILKQLEEFEGFDAYVSWNMPHTSEEVVKKIIKVRDFGDINFGVFKDGIFIGRAMLRNFRDKQESAFKKSAFLSFWVLPPYQEYAKEVVKEMCQLGFEELKLRKIFAPIFANNSRMKQVLEDLSFSLMGRLKNHYLKNGVEHDSLRYELFLEDWKKKS